MTSATPIPTKSAIALNDAAFEAFLAGRSEPAWVTERRKQAFAIAKTLAWPTLRDEEWRRTDIRMFKLDPFLSKLGRTPDEQSRAAVAPAWETLATTYGNGIEQINGVTTRAASAADLGGAIFLDLTTAVVKHPELLQRYLSTTNVEPSADVFAALHAAYWTGGTLLYVPKGVKLEAPLFSLVAMAGDQSVDLDHTIVILEDDAEATLIRELGSFGQSAAASLHLGGVELFVGRGSRLRFVNLQNWDENTWHFSRDRAVVEADGVVQWTVGALGSRLSKVNQEVALAGEGSKAQVNGVMFTTGRQHLAYFTRQDHQAVHTTSDLLYKSGLNDSSRVVWKGMIRVEKEAQLTDAYQKNDSLILSESARADSIPGLEIEANDVRCTHGATAGPVDDEMVFYLQARGISRETAVRLIVEGFFANVYDRITVEPVRETLRRAVAEKLHLGGEPAAPAKAIS